MKRGCVIVIYCSICCLVFADDLALPSGRLYKNYTVTRMETDGITISHSSGIAKVTFDELPKELQLKYGYDPVKAAQAKRMTEDAKASQKAADLAKLNEDRRVAAAKIQEDEVAAAEARKIADEAKASKQTTDMLPLEGQDLVAWKLARHAAVIKCGEINTPRGNPRNASPDYTVKGEPRHGVMTIDATGDWIFQFQFVSSTKWATLNIKIHVTNYGNEMRVEGITFDER